MPLIKQFEDIHAWQEARILTKKVYAAAAAGDFARDFSLRNQIQRAALSSMNNIAEGFDCDSKRDFARFLGYARRSAVEVQSMLYAAVDLCYITSQTFDALYEQARLTKALIGAFKHSIQARQPTKLDT
jgi:four helix bundle protein